MSHSLRQLSSTHTSASTHHAATCICHACSQEKWKKKKKNSCISKRGQTRSRTNTHARAGGRTEAWTLWTRKAENAAGGGQGEFTHSSYLGCFVQVLVVNTPNLWGIHGRVNTTEVALVLVCVCKSVNMLVSELQCTDEKRNQPHETP